MYHKVEICGINTSKLTVLTEEEKRDLLTKAQSGDKAAREKLITGNLKLVLSVIQSFQNRGENPDDLFQIGCIGLIKAVDHFDLTQEVKFSTYAVPLVVGEIRLTNTYVEAFGKLTIVKTFAGDLPESERPEIRLTVTGPGGFTENVVLNAENGWKTVLDKLPQGKYTVTEDLENADVKDYILDSEVSAAVEFTDVLQEATITVTNTYTEAFGTLTVRKQFVGDLPEELRPEIRVVVFGPDEFQQEILLNAANDWTVTLTGLTQGFYTLQEDLSSATVKNYGVKAYIGDGVTFDDQLTEATLVVTNEYWYVPETGDSFDPILWTGIGGVSALALLVLLIVKRRREEESSAN